MEKQGKNPEENQPAEEIAEDIELEELSPEQEINQEQAADEAEAQEILEDASEQIIEDLNKEVANLKDKLLRQMAESENIRTRSVKLIDEAKEYSIFSFSKDLVLVMDNLTRALEHLPKNMTEEAQSIVEGVKMTKKELESAFKKHALESIEPQSGEKFDYRYHHAISQMVTDEHKAGTIVQTMQIGYKIKDRLIRPAAVSVAKSS